MTKYIYLFYILLGVCLLAGFGSAFGSGQEHDVVRTVDLENSAVALCNISESNNGQEKKEINNESYHFYKVGIGGAATSFSFRTFLFYTSPSPRDRQKNRIPSSGLKKKREHPNGTTDGET